MGPIKDRNRNLRNHRNSEERTSETSVTDTAESGDDLNTTSSGGIGTKWKRKKYFFALNAILSVEFFAMTGIVVLCLFQEDLREFMNSQTWIPYVSISIYIVLLTLLTFFNRLIEIFPLNLLALVLMTVLYGVFLGAAAVQFNLFTIAVMTSSTSLVLGVMSLLGLVLPCDITHWIYLIIVPSLTLAVVPSLAAAAHEIRVVEPTRVLISGLLAMFLLTLLIFSMQSLIKGEMGEVYANERVRGVLQLYTQRLGILLQAMSAIVQIIVCWGNPREI